MSRVAHLIETDGPGGAERIVAQLARTLQRQGVENVVFLPPQGEGWLARQLDGSGVAIDHFDLQRPLSPRCARLLAQAFRRHRVDIAHSHEFSMAVYGAWAARLAAIPHVITMHGGRYYAGAWRRRLAMRAAIALSAQSVAVSSSVAHHLAQDLGLDPSAILRIPNGVDHTPPERVTLRQELGLAPGDRLIVAIGNLYPVKGHQHLIDALGLLEGGHPSLHCAIAGRGDLADALIDRARHRGVGDRVHLLGLRADVPAVLAAADIFALPSLSEGLPLALLEAMFAGRPIVASRVGDVAIALGDGEAGVLVEPGDPGAIAAAVDGLLANPDRAADVGRRAAARAQAEYGIATMVDRYLQLYQATLSPVQTSPSLGSPHSAQSRSSP